MKTGKPYTIEYRVFHRDGHIMWMRSLNAIIPDAASGKIRIFAVIQDITELMATRGDAFAYWSHVPAAVGIFELSEPIVTRNQTLRLNQYFNAKVAQSGDTLRDRFFAAVQASYKQGQTEYEEAYDVQLSNELTIRLIASAKVIVRSGAPFCFCAVNPCIKAPE